MPVAIVDCNNFFASCEKLFRPDLKDKPVVVLSNNDGCVIARSREAKALGIPMGAPFHLIRKQLDKQGVHYFSSNYTLYGNLSNRILSILHYFSPFVEAYSVDEAFIDLSHISLSEVEKTLHQIQRCISKWVGIPVGVGAGYTKTLAKLAVDTAKNDPVRKSVYALFDKQEMEKLLLTTPVEEIWGLGRGYANRLSKYNITTPAHFAAMSDGWVRKNFGVVGLRLVKELRGEPCIGLKLHIDPKKNIAATRSFGKDICSLEEMREAITIFTSRAAEKLRKQKSLASCISVFLVVSMPFSDTRRYSTLATTISFSHPTDYTPDIVNHAMMGITAIWRNDVRYNKGGVMLGGISPDVAVQTTFWNNETDRQKKLMKTVDRINTKFGPETVNVSSRGISHRWKPRKRFQSPCYTTAVPDLRSVR